MPKRPTKIDPEVPDTTPMEDSKPGEEIAPEKIALDELQRRINESLNTMAKSEDWMTGAPPTSASPLPEPATKAIVETVVQNFQTCYDYHGTLWTSIPGMPSDEKSVRDLLRRLVASKRISFRTCGMDVNPAIQRLPDRYYNLAKPNVSR